MKTYGGSDTIYGIGVIGAAFYFLQQAHTFIEVVMGLGKAIFWPGVVLYRVLGLLKL